MIKKIFWAVLIFPVVGFVLEVKPWFGNVYELYLTTKYAYSHYTRFEGNSTPFHGSSNDNLLYLDLDFPCSQDWSLDGDLEFFSTPRHSFNFRTIGFQVRHLFSDDILGDPFTFGVGGNVRVVSKDGWKDMSSPYHGPVEVQINAALGKEWAGTEDWKARIWGFGTLGISNRGSPWFRGDLGIEGNIHDANLLEFFLEGVRGFGDRTSIPLNPFPGYASTKQQIIDLAVGYGRRFGVYGTLRLEYKRRVFAKVAPSQVNTFAISYLLPFSF